MKSPPTRLTGSRPSSRPLRYFVADDKELTPRAMAQRIHYHLMGLKDRAAHADPPAPPASDEE